MTLKGGTTQACAACKYQRRKCSSECLLAPYFPPDQPKMFQRVHRLFGVSNIHKILKQLDPVQKKAAMGSVIYQSAIRDKFPVHGCCGIIQNLEFQICQALEELHAVRAQLSFYRQQQQQHQQQQQQQLDLSSSPPNESSSDLQLAMGLPHNNNNNNNDDDDDDGPLTLFNQDFVHGGSAHHYSFQNSVTNVGYNSEVCLDDKDNNIAVSSFWGPRNDEDGHVNNSNNNPIAMQSQLVVTQQQLSMQQEPAVQDYDEMHLFFDPLDDRQSYIHSKEAYESSSESSMKDATQSSMEQVGDNELKNAAACFSLTSVN